MYLVSFNTKKRKKKKKVTFWRVVKVGFVVLFLNSCIVFRVADFPFPRMPVIKQVSDLCWDNFVQYFKTVFQKSAAEPEFSCRLGKLTVHTDKSEENLTTRVRFLMKKGISFVPYR